MACASIDDIVDEINYLIDEQLSFLNSNACLGDENACEEYERRSDRIRSLCFKLDRYSHEAEAVLAHA